jgi:hypothetical protein
MEIMFRYFFKKWPLWGGRAGPLFNGRAGPPTLAEPVHLLVEPGLFHNNTTPNQS